MQQAACTAREAAEAVGLVCEGLDCRRVLDSDDESLGEVDGAWGRLLDLAGADPESSEALTRWYSKGAGYWEVGGRCGGMGWLTLTSGRVCRQMTCQPRWTACWGGLRCLMSPTCASRDSL